jgi:hypothetical protein
MGKNPNTSAIAVIIESSFFMVGSRVVGRLVGRVVSLLVSLLVSYVLCNIAN